MSEENLKACAHCGDKPIRASVDQGNFVYCECQKPCKTKEEAIKAWNTRQSPESKKIEEALGEINGKIRHWKGMWIDTDFESIAVNETNSLIKLKSILEGGE